MGIVAPMFSMCALTFAAASAAFVGRVVAISSGRMRPSEMRVLDLTQATPFVVRSTKHLANLFEMPVLFYVACLLALHVQGYRPGVVDGMLWLPWLYVGFRAAHSIVHLTINVLRLRLLLFMASNVFLAIFWVRLVLSF